MNVPEIREALLLAQELDTIVDHQDARYPNVGVVSQEAAAAIRRQQARIQELEAMLEAVGAGGVSAQRVTQAKDHIEQDLKMVAVQEPFGYFKAEPFGWRDCAETDEGAIALYEAPQPQADALDTDRLDWLIEQGCSNGVVYEGLDKSFWMVWLDGHDAHKDKHQIGRYHTAREAIDIAKATGVDSSVALPVQAVEKSATHGMNLHQRILHVGGRENAQTYIEFGSVAAVRALVDQVLRDLPDSAHGFVMPAPPAAGRRTGCGTLAVY